MSRRRDQGGRNRLPMAVRTRLAHEAEARKSPAERETERRIRAMNRELYPQPWDTEDEPED